MSDRQSLLEPDGWSNMMDSMYEENWWDEDEDEDEIHTGIHPDHFPLQQQPRKKKKKEKFKRLRRVFSVSNMRSSGSPSPQRKKVNARTISVRSFAVNADMVVEGVTGGKKKMHASLFALAELRLLDANGVARNFVYDPAVWLNAWRACKDPQGWLKLRHVVLEGSREASMEGQYWIAAGPESKKGAPKRVPLFVAEHTFEYCQLIDFGSRGGIDRVEGLRQFKYKTSAHFIYEDIIDTAIFMKKQKLCDPCVLVCGNPRSFGGNLCGEWSVEESVCMRTNLLDLVNNPRRLPIEREWGKYSLPEFGGLYVPNAAVIRTNERTGFRFMQQPMKMAFYIAAAQPHRRKTLERQIDCALQTALEKGHDVVVLPAWGCGHLGGDPHEVALCFRKAVIRRFKGCFKHVVFSFLRDPEAYKAFSGVYGAPLMKSPENERGEILRGISSSSSSSEDDSYSDEDIIFFE